MIKNQYLKAITLHRNAPSNNYRDAYLWEWDLNNGTLILDSEFTARCGYNIEPGQLNIDFWENLLHIKDKNKVRESLERAKATKQKQWAYTYRLLQADGSYKYIRHSAFILYNEAEMPYRLTGTISSTNKTIITSSISKKELQEDIIKVRSILEGLPQMAWTASPDGNIDYFTNSWYEYTGQSIEEAMNMGCRNALHPLDDKRAFPIYSNAIINKQPYDIEKRIKRASDGQYRWHLVRAMPVFDAQGNLVLWAGTCTDIHDQKMVAEELEEKVKQRTIELQQANVELERSNTELEQFAYIASHDLQEPLRKIQILSDLLQKDISAKDLENAECLIQKIQLSAKRMSDLLKDLLNYSRLSYKENYQFKAVNLSKSLKNVLNDFEIAITQKNACIQFNELPEIEAIELLIYQLFHNLFSNSLKFVAAERTPLISITSHDLTVIEKSTFQLEANNEYCKIVFQDNGIGFDNQFAERIFTIFQRLNNMESYPGTGIGLALCKKIVINHQGLIFADAIEGQGAVFTIILPYIQNK